jgi:glycosyl transferase family 87
MAASQGELIRPAGGHPARQAGGRRGLIACAIVFVVLTALYIADLLSHQLLNWFDLGVYIDAGKIALHDPSHLYSLSVDDRGFTYTPFAALVFAPLSTVSWHLLERVVTALSLVSVPITLWLTFGGLRWRGARRLAAALALAGVSLWLEPVQRALQYGQIELLLMLLIVWDLCQPDTRRFKGIGIGIAAGIKLVPLVFIPYLLLAGKIRQAVVAAAMFVVTTVIGWVFIPSTFSSYWLSGYFEHPGGIGLVGGIRNQSIDGMLIKIVGSINGAKPAWIVISLIVGVTGILASAALHRAGQPVAGWVTCALTGLLISPVSWDHHWVWLLPLLAVFVDWAVRSRDIVRQAWWAAVTAVVLLFAAYPKTLHGPAAYVPQGGLLGVVNDQPLVSHAAALHPALLITRNIFVIGGLILFAALLIVAWRVRSAAKPATS